MTKSLFDAFSDGILAIIITIMVLELKFRTSQQFVALKKTRALDVVLHDEFHLRWDLP